MLTMTWGTEKVPGSLCRESSLLLPISPGSWVCNLQGIPSPGSAEDHPSWRRGWLSAHGDPAVGAPHVLHEEAAQKRSAPSHPGVE